MRVYVILVEVPELYIYMFYNVCKDEKTAKGVVNNLVKCTDNKYKIIPMEVK